MKKYIIIILLLLPALAFAGAKSFQVDSGSTLTTSLVSYYKLEDATDFFGPNNLTAVNQASFVAGKVNNAVTLDGTDDYLDGGDVLDFERTQAFSVNAWVKRATTGASMSIAGKYDEVNDTGWIFYFPSSNIIRLLLANGAANLIHVGSNNAFTDTTAYHMYTLVYTGSSAASGVSFYVDGALEADTTVSDSLTATTLNAISFNIGSDNDGAFADMNGLIDEVGVRSKALSTTEITDLYNGG